MAKCKTNGCKTEAIFGLPGGRRSFCKVHKAPEMIDLKNRKCEHPGCTTRATCASTENGNKTAHYCSLHKKDGMSDVINKKCANEDCTTRPTFGLKGGKALYCVKHRIALSGKMCQFKGCQIRATFGLEKERKERFCFAHKTDGMIDIFRQKCAFKGCNTHPCFSTCADDLLRYCSKHKSADMVDVVHPKCEHPTCIIQPSFGFSGGCVRFCTTHKLDGMIDLKSKSCEFPGCLIKPIFGYELGKKIYCAKHREPTMVDVVNKRCEQPNCNIGASFGFEGGNRIFCSRHAKPDMLCLMNNFCEFKDCYTRRSYGFRNGPARFCKKHKETGMEDVTTKTCVVENCDYRPFYGFPGKTSHCLKHKTAGMIIYPTKRCVEIGCSNPAIYGVMIHEHCLIHKTPDEVNIMERKCKTCDFLAILDQNGNCETCDPLLFKRVRLQKQNMVVDFLLQNGIDLKQIDRMIDKGECGKERPDIVIDCGTHILIIEVDEYQHSNRPCECEQTRMVNVSQSNGMKTVFLRINPDKYKISEGLQMDKTPRRLQVLLEWTKHLSREVPKDFLSVMYLYFDNYVYGEEELHCIMPEE